MLSAPPAGTNTASQNLAIHLGAIIRAVRCLGYSLCGAGSSLYALSTVPRVTILISPELAAAIAFISGSQQCVPEPSAELYWPWDNCREAIAAVHIPQYQTLGIHTISPSTSRSNQFCIWTSAIRIRTVIRALRNIRTLLCGINSSVHASYTTL